MAKGSLQHKNYDDFINRGSIEAEIDNIYKRISIKSLLNSYIYFFFMVQRRRSNYVDGMGTIAVHKKGRTTP